MSYWAMQEAVLTAYRQRDFAQCFALLDQFLDCAAGIDKGRALSFKAGIIAQVAPQRCAEGLTLLEEALRLATSEPELIVDILVNALLLCYKMGDVERASSYAAEALRLLQQYQHLEYVSRHQYRLHLNMGLIATLRDDSPTALWHFMHGATSLLASGLNEDNRGLLFLLYVHAAETCLNMGRVPEAEEFMDKARPHAGLDTHRVRWEIFSAEIFLAKGMYQEAVKRLDEAEAANKAGWIPVNVVRCHLTRARIAQHTADFRGFNRFIALAQAEAIEHSIDYLLSQIQRLQRKPFNTLGVAR